MTALDDGRERWSVAQNTLSVSDTPNFMIENTFLKWKTSDGDMPGFIVIALATLPLPEEVGFFASFSNGAEDPMTIWAIDLRSLI